MQLFFSLSHKMSLRKATAAAPMELSRSEVDPWSVSQLQAWLASRNLSRGQDWILSSISMIKMLLGAPGSSSIRPASFFLLLLLLTTAPTR